MWSGDDEHLDVGERCSVAAEALPMMGSIFTYCTSKDTNVPVQFFMFLCVSSILTYARCVDEWISDICGPQRMNI